MRIYVSNLEPSLQVTLCDEDPLDLTNVAIGITLKAYHRFFHGELLWTADVPVGDRTFVDGCTVLDHEWAAGETDSPGQQRIKAVIAWPPDGEEQEIRLLDSVKIRT